MKNTPYFFKYTLMDAWNNDIYETKIYNQEISNVMMVDYANDIPSIKPNTLPLEKIRDILQYIEDNEENIFSLSNENIEFPMVLDGFDSRIEVCMKNKKTLLFASNLWAWENRDREKAPNAWILIDLVNYIKDIFQENKINAMCLSLNLDN